MERLLVWCAQIFLSLRPVTNFDEVTFHFIDCIHNHLQTKSQVLLIVLKLIPEVAACIWTCSLTHYFLLAIQFFHYSRKVMGKATSPYLQKLIECVAVDVLNQYNFKAIRIFSLYPQNSNRTILLAISVFKNDNVKWLQLGGHWTQIMNACLM